MQEKVFCSLPLQKVTFSLRCQKVTFLRATGRAHHTTPKVTLPSKRQYQITSKKSTANFFE
ncbi:hypothetical protein, partial [Klebsiella pneumoniae]|uniref:hypothetical protein n=1 Tax=Klebsiella pneumoniae TaxID=573 RepID=UPI00298E7B6B